ncbi:MAG TPA: 30S ribosomal protein S4 [Candidatus Peribacterales bacterium]|nr:30S ribosomal protein S4 [Candidatus Peribacterales bacterium]
MKFTGPKAKRVRRQGANIYGSDKYDRILQKKPYGPGKSPKARAGKKSEYAGQLSEKQKVRDMFLVSERQFHNYYQKAQKSRSSTGETILRLLEQRFDNAIYRAGFALTRLQSRQMAGHGMFSINGRRCTIPSRPMKEGDVVEIRPRSAASPMFATILPATEKFVPPAWLKADASKLRIEIVGSPQPDHFEQGLDIQKVVELYSR